MLHYKGREGVGGRKGRDGQGQLTYMISHDGRTAVSISSWAGL